MKKVLLPFFLLIVPVFSFAKAVGKHHRDLLFIENKGQVRDQYNQQRADIDFCLRGNGVNVFFGSGALHYQWTDRGVLPHPKGTQIKDIRSSMKLYESSSRKAELYRMDVVLIGADKNAVLTTTNEAAYQEHYYLPGCDGSTASSYQKVTYHNVYSNIDWVIYTDKEGRMKYDFEVRPGGNVADIRIAYKGATGLKYHTDGSIVATTPMGSVTEDKPYSYQLEGNKVVSSEFKLADGVLSFETGSYDPNQTLIIDPTLEWATYYGGADFDNGKGVATDTFGNVYVTGSTSSTDNIATVGAFRTTLTGAQYSSDALLAKFDADGARRWATYYGGSIDDYAFGISCDIYGNIFICGGTNSGSGLGTPGSFKPSFSGDPLGADAFIAKFDSGGRRRWGTYYGGENADQGVSVSTDPDGNVYMAGSTSSPDSIASRNSYQDAPVNAGYDAFLVKFDSAGARQWGTYYGGTENDAAASCGVDATGHVYLGGQTNSETNIATTGTHQPVFAGFADAFIVRFTSEGKRRWGTYFGGDNTEWFYSLDCDGEGNVYIAGQTASATGIASNRAHQTVAGDTSEWIADSYLAKFDSTGMRSWATYYGGEGGDDIGWAVSWDGYNNIYMGGNTTSSYNISTTGTYQDTFGGDFDAYLVKFNSDGQRIWGTYYGGTGWDEGWAVACGKGGKVYLVGTANTPGMATPDVHQDTLGGFSDIYIVKFCDLPFLTTPVTGNDSICAGSTNTYSIRAIEGATYIWNLPKGWTGNSNGNSITATADTASGRISVRAVLCNDTSDEQSFDVHVRPEVPAVITVDGFELGTVYTHSSYQWYRDGQAIPGATDPVLNVTQNGDYRVRVVNAGGCIDTSVIYTVTNVSINGPDDLKRAVKIYPNPATEVLYIQTPLPVDVMIHSMDGKLALQQQQASSIDLHALSAGVYMIFVRDSKGLLIKTEKLVKQ